MQTANQLDVSGEEQVIRRIAAANLAHACDRARELVAANHGDERAAELLTELAEELARTAPPRAPTPQLPPAVAQANELIAVGRLEDAEVVLRNHLGRVRHDPPAMHLMGEIAARCGFREDAVRILKKSAEIHSGSAQAWAGLGTTYHRIACHMDWPELLPDTIEALDRALALDPDYEAALDYKAAVLQQMRQLDEARPAYERLVVMRPDCSWHWMNYAHVIKTLGNFRLGVAANRMAVALDPLNGAAWWNLANLKLAKFFAHDVERMTVALDNPKLTDTDRVSIHFALAKAFDQSRDYEKAAAHLREGNDLRNKLHPPDLDFAKEHAASVKRVFTPEFFRERQGWGDPSKAPIFIVGMPRAGSTLLEQILSSHSQIEGTEELFIILQLGGELGKANQGKSPDQIISALTESEVATLGGRFILMAERHRVTDRPFFTDKNPQNWQYTGLIHLALPNAKIIDIRRNPLDCCFANYAQHFQTGANFSYSQVELGKYYSNYVRTMRHFEEVLPGVVHRVIYEDLVENFEAEVRRLFEYLELPFEEQCLRFFETDRPVHTPSSEQVRQPINRAGIGKWENYEPWLGDLKAALGETIGDWR